MLLNCLFKASLAPLRVPSAELGALRIRAKRRTRRIDDRGRLARAALGIANIPYFCYYRIIEPRRYRV
jgi:hypothetical protein